jgi:hypothetical protein
MSGSDKIKQHNESYIHYKLSICNIFLLVRLKPLYFLLLFLYQRPPSWQFHIRILFYFSPFRFLIVLLSSGQSLTWKPVSRSWSVWQCCLALWITAVLAFSIVRYSKRHGLQEMESTSFLNYGGFSTGENKLCTRNSDKAFIRSETHIFFLGKAELY